AFLSLHRAQRDLHSFPTRRSSDLVVLFGVVAVTASGSSIEVARPAAAPRYTPMPAVPSTAPDVGERSARTYVRLWGAFALPIEGGEVPTDPELLPGAQ